MTLILAITISASLYFSLQGAIAGTYVLLFILGLNVLMVSYSASIFGGLYHCIMKNSEEYLQSVIAKRGENNEGSQFLIRAMLLVSVYHVYTLGYIFFSGVATVTVTIALVSTVLNILEKKVS
jgi:hypothetical protein